MEFLLEFSDNHESSFEFWRSDGGAVRRIGVATREKSRSRFFPSSRV
jgi:hypothetical protein